MTKAKSTRFYIGLPPLTLADNKTLTFTYTVYDVISGWQSTNS